MGSVHREIDGGWADCPAPVSCELPFHVQDMTVVEAEAMPLRVLYPIFELLDPPTRTYMTAAAGLCREWLDAAGKLHRGYDLPARVFDDGGAKWYQHGELHRDGDRPAAIDADGGLSWYRRGKLHREGDLPASITRNGWLSWARDGVGWREDPNRPHSISPDGIWEWGDETGQYHREDGPAVIFPNGMAEWWTRGSFVEANFTEAEDPEKWNR